MNETEMNSPVPADLSEQMAALQRQVFTLLLALIVVSGTLAVYLFYQSRVLGKEIEALRPQATPIIQAFNANHANLEKFVDQLMAYGQTHPDFRPVLQKYGIAPSSNGTNASRTGTPKK